MSFAEGIISLIAAVVTILGGMSVLGHYFLKRLDKWANAVIDNSAAVRSLTVRVTRLEKTINAQSGDV